MLKIVLVLTMMCPALSGARAQTGSASPITLAISSVPGGGNDTYGRLMARHLPRFLPSHPAIVPTNMPGAAGQIEGNWLYNIAPRDGTAIGITESGFAFASLFGKTKVQYDARRFNWLLSLDSLISLVVVRADAPIASAKELFEREAIIGASSGDSLIVPNLLNNLLGAKLKVVRGYKGANEIMLAMTRGEVQGLSTHWDTLKAVQSDLIRDKKLRVLLQVALAGHPELADVPLVMDYVTDDETRQILQLILVRQAVGRPVVAPPGTPADKVRELRIALERMTADQDFLTDAAKLRLDINVSSGDEVAALIDHAFATPPAIVEKTANALNQAGEIR